MCEFPRGFRGLPFEHIKPGSPATVPVGACECMMWLMGCCGKWGLQRGHVGMLVSYCQISDFSKEFQYLYFLMQKFMF